MPAPSKVPDKLAIGNPMSFAPTMALTAVGFQPNLAYLHTKTPKPPDNIIVQQFTSIAANDKINTIPLINRTSCLNVIQPVQKIATLNNFSCVNVKLNATVVPIVKLNSLPSRLNGSPNLLSHLETAVPTVLSAKPSNVAAQGLAPNHAAAAPTRGVGGEVSNPLYNGASCANGKDVSNSVLAAELPLTGCKAATESVQSKSRMGECQDQAEDHRTQDKCRQVGPLSIL